MPLRTVTLRLTRLLCSRALLFSASSFLCSPLLLLSPFSPPETPRTAIVFAAQGAAVGRADAAGLGRGVLRAMVQQPCRCYPAVLL